MFRAEQQPLLWLVEFCLYLTLLSVLQLIAGYVTLTLIPSSMPSKFKPIFILGFIFVLAMTYRYLVDYHTHLQAAMLGGLSLGFTVPLNAVALLGLARRGYRPTSYLQTIIRISFPIAVPSSKHPAEPPLRQLFRGSVYLALMIGFVGPLFISQHTTGGPGMYLAAVGVMFTVAPGVLNICAALAGFLGAPSPSPFRAPFFSPTLGSFWAGRWNAPVSTALRAGVYEPLCAAGCSKGLAVLACFAVSGAAHEAIMVYSRSYGTGGLWMAFFVLHGLLVLLERGAQEWLPSPGWRRWLIAGPVMLATFVLLFVPAAQRTGIDVRGVESFNEISNVAKAGLDALRGMLQISRVGRDVLSN